MLEFIPHYSSSAGNLYEVRDGDHALAIECGVRFSLMQSSLDHQITRLDAVLLTHAHADHSSAVHRVIRSGVDVYASEETLGILDIDGHRAHPIAVDHAFTVGSWRVRAFEVPHDDEGCLGFLVQGMSGERLFFATDCAYIPVKWPKGTAIVAVECNWSASLLRGSQAEVQLKRRILSTHMSLERVLQFLAANDLSSVRTIHLLHLSDEHSSEAAFKEAVQRATGKVVHVAPKNGGSA